MKSKQRMVYVTLLIWCPSELKQRWLALTMCCQLCTPNYWHDFFLPDFSQQHFFPAKENFTPESFFGIMYEKKKCQQKSSRKKFPRNKFSRMLQLSAVARKLQKYQNKLLLLAGPVLLSAAAVRRLPLNICWGQEVRNTERKTRSAENLEN